MAGFDEGGYDARPVPPEAHPSAAGGLNEAACEGYPVKKTVWPATKLRPANDQPHEEEAASKQHAAK